MVNVYRHCLYIDFTILHNLSLSIMGFSGILSRVSIHSSLLDAQPIIYFSNFFCRFLRNPTGSAIFHAMYNKSHTRASPYIIGMLSGSLFMKLQNSGFKLSQFTAAVSFFFSVVVLVLCMASGNLLGLKYQAEYDPLISGIYAAVNRLVWAFGTAVFVLSLSFGDIRK